MLEKCEKSGPSSHLTVCECPVCFGIGLGHAQLIHFLSCLQNILQNVLCTLANLVHLDFSIAALQFVRIADRFTVFSVAWTSWHSCYLAAKCYEYSGLDYAIYVFQTVSICNEFTAIILVKRTNALIIMWNIRDWMAWSRGRVQWVNVFNDSAIISITLTSWADWCTSCTRRVSV